MLTIKVFLSDSGRIANLKKDFPLYQGQFQDKLLDVYVPTSILAPAFTQENYIGYLSGTSDPASATLTNLVSTNKGRTPLNGDTIFFINTSSTTYTYKKFVYGNGSWLGSSVNYIQFANPFIANVKIACLAVKTNGEQYQSQVRAMRYIKNVTIDNVEYALYERKLPKEFTTYFGAYPQAPKMVINVVNVGNDSTIYSIVTSQTCDFEVLPSAIIDNDATIEPSEYDSLNATVNTHTAQIGTLTTQVGGFDTRITANTSAIAVNTANIASNSSRISALEAGETYVGQLNLTAGATFPPTSQTMANFVQTKVSRQPKNNDVVMVYRVITGGSDLVYKFRYNGTSWDYYQIPAVEKAENGEYGVIKGTLGGTNDVILDVSNGEVVDIEVSNKSIKVNLDKVDNILNGTQVVPEAEKATKDGSGNTITSTYLTNATGATKTFVKDNFLPREFNQAHYLVGTSEGQSFNLTKPTSGTIDISVPASIGYTTLVEASYLLPSDISFQLSNKNGYTSVFYVSSSANKNCSFVLTTSIYVGGSWITANSKATDSYSLSSGSVTTLKFEEDLDDLADIYQLVNGSMVKQKLEIMSTDSTSATISVYKGGNYASRMYLNTVAYTITQTTGVLGQIRTLVAESVSVDASEVLIKIPNSVEYVSDCLYELTFTTNTLETTTTNVYLTRDNTERTAIYSYGSANAKFVDFCMLEEGISNNYRALLYFKTDKFYMQNFNIDNIAEGSDYIVVEPNASGSRIVVELDGTKVESSRATTGSTKLITSGAVYTDLSYKQDYLVSGTNIKSINGNSILGSGNLNLSGVPSGGTTGQSLVKHSDTNYDVEWSSVLAGATVDTNNYAHFESATPTTYTAGSGIDITNNVISQMGDVYSDDIVSETLVGGSGVEVLSFSTQDNHWHMANTKVDDSLEIESDLIISGIENITNGTSSLFWHGTQAQYDAIGTYNSDTLYIIVG